MKRLGKYEIQTKLGQGAMGSVYKAWHPVLEISVALKTIQDARLDQTEILARFKTEGRALAQLRHPHVVTIYDPAHLPSAEHVLSGCVRPGRGSAAIEQNVRGGYGYWPTLPWL